MHCGNIYILEQRNRVTEGERERAKRKHLIETKCFNDLICCIRLSFKSFSLYLNLKKKITKAKRRNHKNRHFISILLWLSIRWQWIKSFNQSENKSVNHWSLPYKACHRANENFTWEKKIKMWMKKIDFALWRRRLISCFSWSGSTSEFWWRQTVIDWDISFTKINLISFSIP